MKKIVGVALLASMITLPALAQSTATPAAKAEAVHGEMWRASKLKGLNVYNDKDEKLGDINEILIDKAGKVAGVVVGVGGFIGMGEHDIMVDMNKLKFVDEPVRTASTTTSNTGTSKKSTNDHKWYPDHAVFAGADKDKLKSIPQFKYD